MKRLKLHIILILLVIFVAEACKVRFINDGLINADNIRPTKLYRLIEENQFEYDYLSIKFSAEVFNEDNKETFSGVIRIKHDSIIWISLRVLNIEGARMIITADSVKYLNRINTTYFVGDYKFITEIFAIDLDYKAIQGIITNNFFFYPAPEDTVKAIQEFKPCDDSMCYCMSSISQRKFKRYYIDRKKTEKLERKLTKEDRIGYETNEFVFQIVKVLPTIYRICEMQIKNYYQNQSLKITYDKHFRVGTQFFPEQIFINLISKQISAQLNLQIESVTIESEKLSFPFKVSDKYQEIKLN